MISRIVIVVLFIGSLSLAAISTSRTAGDNELEILSLPVENQKRLLKSDRKTIERLMQVAEDITLPFDVRWKSIMALGFLEKQNINPTYLSLANSKEWFVKNGLLITMDENNHPQRFVAAKKMVKDPSLIVRSSAFDILMQEPIHRDLLWEELFNSQNVRKNRSLWVRPKIIHHMSQNPRSHEKAFFEKLAKENEPEIVILANRGLQKIKALSANSESAPATKAY